MAPKQPTPSQYQKLRKDVDTLMEWHHDVLLTEKNLTDFRAGEDKTRKRKLLADAGQFLVVLTILIWAVIEYLSRSHP